MLCLYAFNINSRSAKALTNIISVLFGKWKFVIMASTPLNLKPDLYKMMNNSLDGTDNTNAILVIKRNGIIIGYMHMYVEYGITCLADVVINSDEQNDTRCFLTKTCISIAKSFASNDHRTLRIYRSYGSKNRILSEYWLGPVLKKAGFTFTGKYMDYARFF